MKSLKTSLAAVGLAAMAYLAPTPSNAGIVQLVSDDWHYSNDGHIEGAAQTSGSKLGLGEGNIRAYVNDLSSYADMVTPVSGIDDAGSWDDNYFIAHNGGSGVTKIDLSNGFGVGTSDTSGTGVNGISSVFTYNGKDHFAAIDSLDDTIKYFEWGNSTPVATGPNIGSNYTGLEVLADSVTDLGKIPFLVSRNTDFGAKMDQYFDGALVESYNDDIGAIITDMAYNSDSGVLTTSFKEGMASGGMANYDFSSHVVPEPSTLALLGVGALGALALRRLKH